MPIPQLTPRYRLHGVSIFLSASVPTPERREEYERIPEAPLRIEEAVVCIARAIFMEGGTLVFGGHPSISPLVARVVDHYYLPAPAEKTHRGGDRESHDVQWKNPSLVIYQSRVWEKHWAETTERLARHPLVRIEWTKGVDGESVDPAVKDRPQAPRSMKKMREEMVENTSPIAMIAIGGMKGVLDEAQIFADLRPRKPIFALATTGGAAAMLSRREEYRDRVQVTDIDAEDLVRKFWKQQEGDQAPDRIGEEDRRKFYVPYAFVAQRIVAQIVKNSN